MTTIKRISLTSFSLLKEVVLNQIKGSNSRSLWLSITVRRVVLGIRIVCLTSSGWNILPNLSSSKMRGTTSCLILRSTTRYIRCRSTVAHGSCWTGSVPACTSWADWVHWTRVSSLRGQGRICAWWLHHWHLVGLETRLSWTCWKSCLISGRVLPNSVHRRLSRVVIGSIRRVSTHVERILCVQRWILLMLGRSSIVIVTRALFVHSWDSATHLVMVARRIRRVSLLLVVVRSLSAHGAHISHIGCIKLVVVSWGSAIRIIVGSYLWANHTSLSISRSELSNVATVVRTISSSLIVALTPSVHLMWIRSQLIDNWSSSLSVSVSPVVIGRVGCGLVHSNVDIDAGHELLPVHNQVEWTCTVMSQLSENNVLCNARQRIMFTKECGLQQNFSRLFERALS